MSFCCLNFFMCGSSLPSDTRYQQTECNIYPIQFYRMIFITGNIGPLKYSASIVRWWWFIVQVNNALFYTYFLSFHYISKHLMVLTLLYVYIYFVFSLLNLHNYLILFFKSLWVPSQFCRLVVCCRTLTSTNVGFYFHVTARAIAFPAVTPAVCFHVCKYRRYRRCQKFPDRNCLRLTWMVSPTRLLIITI